MKKVAFVLVDRANYGRLKPLMDHCWTGHGLSCYAICAGSMVLDRFGHPVDMLYKDGFGCHEKLFISLEGNTPATMARGIGLAVNEFVGAFERLQPDIVVIIGDRFEALGAAIAAAYTKRCILHLQGGEISGSLDEVTRHAITKLAHYHAPATEKAKQNIIQMGERPETIVSVGCPVSDVALRMKCEPNNKILCVMHPDTNRELEGNVNLMRRLLFLLACNNEPTLMLWPNIDAGSDAMSKILRQYAHDEKETWLEVAKNFPPEEYLKLLGSARLCIGNSSSFIRDAGFFGTPVVMYDNRQAGRECGENVYWMHPLMTPPNQICGLTEILSNAARIPNTLYGDGNVCPRITAALPGLEWYPKRFEAVQRPMLQIATPIVADEISCES